MTKSVFRIWETIKKQVSKLTYQVKFYDGEGNLKEIITPVFDYGANPVGKNFFKPHPCLNSKCRKTTTNKSYCSKKCSIASASEK